MLFCFAACHKPYIFYIVDDICKHKTQPMMGRQTQQPRPHGVASGWLTTMLTTTVFVFNRKKKDKLIEHIQRQIHHYGFTLQSLQKRQTRSSKLL